MGKALASYLVSHGGLDPTDSTKLRQLLVTVLPDVAPVADLLAKGLSPVMSAFALANDGDALMSVAAQSLIPQLAQVFAGMHAAMVSGTLALPATQAQLAEQLALLR